MNTPICDFVTRYAATAPLRLHMPGHKGIGRTESLDITEIPGADSLYEADGILAESEKNASEIFGHPTLYSTEGSSLALRAMLYLACLWAKERGKRPVIAAGRNAHKVFSSAAALLDFEVRWLYGTELLSCRLTPEDLEKAFADGDVTAVYVTAPDYLGNCPDLGPLAEVCHRHGALFLVDCAHGAYLKFLTPSRHPMDLGADLCCASAHKTLPVLTGGAYLHISEAHKALINQAKSALSLFGSTSPSYLILQSLDQANRILSEGYGEALARSAAAVDRLKESLSARGFALVGDEPMKLTLAPKSYGYFGFELADYLAEKQIICEFADRDYCVMMFAGAGTASAADRVAEALSDLPKRPAISELPPEPVAHEAVLSIREAALAPAEILPVEQCVGRVLAAPSVACPPAVPILVCGERITPADAAAFAYYGVESLSVVR